MRDVKWLETLTCDRCKKIVQKLKTLYLAGSSAYDYDRSQPLVDLCGDCWDDVMDYIKKAKAGEHAN